MIKQEQLKTPSLMVGRSRLEKIDLKIETRNEAVVGNGILLGYIEECFSDPAILDRNKKNKFRNKSPYMKYIEENIWWGLKRLECGDRRTKSVCGGKKEGT